MTYTRSITDIRGQKGRGFSTIAVLQGDGTRLVVRQVRPSHQDAMVREAIEAGRRVTIHNPDGGRLVHAPEVGEWRRHAAN